MTECNVQNRTIFCDDNLDVLRGINTACIDLIYLDPPFNKNKTFAAPIGSSAEGAEFSDIFREEDVKDEWLVAIKEDQPELFHYLNGIKGVGNSYNFAYLAYMAIRLLECWRVMKKTASIYLHCDPTMSHYLKSLMDCIFGEHCFRNEILWCYSTASTPHIRQFPRCSDTILYYSLGREWTFNKDKIRVPYKGGAPHGGNAWDDGEGLENWRVRKATEGRLPFNWWSDIFKPSAKEKTGYPTQKPL